MARTLQHGTTAPRYNVHHNAYHTHTLLPFMYRRWIFSFPSPSTASVMGACSCSCGTNRDSAQHRTRHTHTLSRTLTCSDSQMTGDRAMPFYARCIVSQSWKQANSTPSGASHDVASVGLLASPTRRRSSVKALSQVAGILPRGACGIPDEQDGNSRGRVRTAHPSLHARPQSLPALVGLAY